MRAGLRCLKQGTKSVRGPLKQSQRPRLSLHLQMMMRPGCHPCLKHISPSNELSWECESEKKKRERESKREREREREREKAPLHKPEIEASICPNLKRPALIFCGSTNPKTPAVSEDLSSRGTPSGVLVSLRKGRSVHGPCPGCLAHLFSAYAWFWMMCISTLFLNNCGAFFVTVLYCVVLQEQNAVLFVVWHPGWEPNERQEGEPQPLGWHQLGSLQMGRESKTTMPEICVWWKKCSGLAEQKGASYRLPSGMNAAAFFM